MHRYLRHHTLWRGAALSALAALAIVTGAAPHVSAQARSAQVARQESCAEVGAYFVGPRVLPYSVQPPRTQSTLKRAMPVTRPAYPALVYVLRGTITIASYSGCGQRTSGSFTLGRAPVGPIPRPQSGTSAQCLPGCYRPATGLTAARGTFTQDAAHPDNPMYVTVTATITSTRLAPQQGRPCPPQNACPLPSVVSSTVAMTNVTGYLQATDGQTVTLSFLPPPAAGQTPSAVVWQGNRGSGAPLSPASK